ncbi:MAG: hypothetical protein GYA42_02165 [Syntrophomonadaceae bacterium]|nr:hypothetical protein [Syntrophomonadaceae bacterium]
MGKRMVMVTAVLLGILLGFFGVFNSVFADGGTLERLVTVAVVLIIYAGLGALWGFFAPERPWRWVLALALPGIIFLAVYMLKEYNPFYLVYMVLILCLSSLGVYGGQALRRQR